MLPSSGSTQKAVIFREVEVSGSIKGEEFFNRLNTYQFLRLKVGIPTGIYCYLLFLVTCLAYSSTLKMEAVCPSETSTGIHGMTTVFTVRAVRNSKSYMKTNSLNKSSSTNRLK
jgi:hypothetical protein